MPCWWLTLPAVLPDVGMDKHPYKIFNAVGEIVMQSAADCRYPKTVELAMLESGYTIRIHGKKLTKTEIRKEVN